MPRVYLTAVRSDKWKTGVFSAFWLRPLAADTASLGAALPSALRSGTTSLPHREAISAVLDDAYGAKIEAAVRKRGEVQALGFTAGFVDDKALPEPGTTKRVLTLVRDFCFDPACKDSCADRERENLVRYIRAQINDKRAYAGKRCLELMCAGEAYGVDVLGDVDSAERITAGDLWRHYEKVKQTSRLELFYCGSMDAETVGCMTREMFAQSEGGGAVAVRTTAGPSPQTVRTFRDHLEVSQGKLVIGWRMCDHYPATLLASAVFGGTTTSKLFLTVREEMSLCYYAVSRLDRHKRIMTAACGVDFDQMERAKEEILRQWDAMARGDFTGEELENARNSLISTLRTTSDHPAKLEEFALGQAVEGTFQTPEQVMESLRRVTAEQVTQAARLAQLDTIYCLEGVSA